MTPVAADLAVVVTWVVAPVLVLAVAHARLRASGSRAISGWSVVAATIGFSTVALSLLPTFAAAAERTFAGHMAQHLLVGLLGPLLLGLGRLHELLPWALPVPLRRRARAVLRPPRSLLAPTMSMVAVWYAWHLPPLYGAAAGSVPVHVLEHAMMLGVGVWFWGTVAPQRRRLGAGVLALFTASVSLGLLGATLALSPTAFYADHVSAATASARLDDQHLGGLLMWTPGGLVYLLAAVTQLVRWLDPGRAADPPATVARKAEVTT